MNLTQFLDAGQPRWSELDGLVSKARRRPEKLGSEGLFRLADLYRETVSDLALARRLFPRDPVVAQLEKSVIRARGLMFDRERSRDGLLSFFAHTYWALIAERMRPMALAAALLFLPALLGALWAGADPETVRAFLPEGFLWVTESRTTDVGYSAPELAGFSTFVMTNNIRVTLIAFIGGITWGLFSGYLMVQNGLILGGVAALAIQAGNSKLLVAAIAAHGLLEFSCIVVGGGAGLAMGRAMLRPGTRSRLDALAAEAMVVVTVAVGTVPWLVLAGLVEGYVSRTGTTWGPSLAIGVLLGVPFWVMVWRHRPTVGIEDQSRAVLLARR